MRAALELSDGLVGLEPGILYHLFRFGLTDNGYGKGDQGAMMIPDKFGKQGLISIPEFN